MNDFSAHKVGSRGFSLLELAIIILILGLLTPLLWRFIAAQTAQKSERESYTLLEEADWALTGYAMAHARLPCPDTDNDGLEDCGANDGKLPYKTLGLPDARARWMRYGVLRRTTGTIDPEADIPPIPTEPPRGADLAAMPIDRFYPFFAFLEDATPSATVTLPVLQTDSSPTPVAGGGKMIVSANVPLGNINSLDFCAMLRVAEDPPPDPATTGHLNIDGRQVAYALALAGDAPDAAAEFTSPTRARAVSPSTLWQRLECGEAIASIGHAHPNVATASVMLYRGLFDYEQVQQQAVELTEAQVLFAVSQVVGAAAGIVDFVSGTLHAAGDALATTGNKFSVGEAVVMGIAAGLQVPMSVVSQITTIHARDMAARRLFFLRQLRAAARGLAQDVMRNAVDADAQGLYQEQYQEQ